METNEIKLLPCPFCGDVEDLSCHHMHDDPRYNFIVKCDNCGAESTDWGTEADAVKAWNRRAPDPDLAKLKALAISYRQAVGCQEDGMDRAFIQVANAKEKLFAYLDGREPDIDDEY